MREFMEVFKYTFKENIRKKSFIISTVVIVIIVMAALIVPSIISKSQASKSGENTNITMSSGSSGTLYFVDKEGLFKEKLPHLKSVLSGYDIKEKAESDIESVKSEIKQDSTKSLLVVKSVSGTPGFDYYVNQYGEGLNPEVINQVFKKIYISGLLEKQNVSVDVIEKSLTDLSVNVNEMGKSKWGGYISSIFIVIILFFAIYFYGYGVSMSVASEKTSRVMEILVTSVKPSRIILGKTAGMGALGLIQLAIIILVGTATYKLVFTEDLIIGGMKLELSGFTPFSLALIIIYFILGYTLYALMHAVVGATVSKAEDLNSAMMPMSFLSIIAFYFSYGTFVIPDSTAAKVASFIPFTSPFSIPSRIMSTDVKLWEIGVSLAILLATIFLIGTLSVKLYSFAVLHYGDRLKLGILFKISKDQSK